MKVNCVYCGRDLTKKPRRALGVVALGGDTPYVCAPSCPNPNARMTWAEKMGMR